MSYEIRFVPTEEKMQSYKPWKEEKSSESLTDVYKYELLSYCMKKRDESPSGIMKQIKFYLHCIVGAAEQEEKTLTYFRWKEAEDHVVYFTGWEFAHDSRVDKDDMIDHAAESLFIFADLIPTPDYFESSDNFYKKYEEISQRIDDFISSATDLAIHDIINDLDEFKEKDDEEER